VPRHHLIERIRAEYLEMPGLRVTTRQASRLWGADAAHCQTALEALVESGFLRARHDGLYVRATEGKIPPPVAAKAELASGHVRASAS
jgi:hypothetical protein